MKPKNEPIESNPKLSRFEEEAITKAYSLSLSGTGYPSNTHVYDLNTSYLRFRMPRKEASFLLKANDFFKRLTFVQGLIFVNDYLEKGKNYRFWWMKYGSKEFYEQERRKLRWKIKTEYQHLMGAS